MPSATSPAAALFCADEKGPPRLMFTMEWAGAFAATQFIPAMLALVGPDPSQARTRTGCRMTPGAMPYVVDPTVPATWVPCPLQSLALVATSGE